MLVIIAGLAGLAVVQSGWFHEYVRQRIITVIEQATGGRVELGRFSFRGPTLTARISQLVLHGKEARRRAAFFASRVRDSGPSDSFLRGERKVDLGIGSGQTSRECASIIYADGSNNFPSPKPHPDPQGNWPRGFF